MRLVITMYIVAGYKMLPHSSHYPTVVIYGLYESLEDARNRQASLCVTSAIEGSSIVRGMGYVTWIKEVPMGDLAGSPLNAFR